MISERKLASEFKGFWQELLPLLSPQFVSLFNSAYITRLTNEWGMPVNGVTIRRGVEHHDLTAELAFNLSRMSYELKQSTDEVFRNPALRSQATDSLLQVLEKYEGVRPSTAELNEDEWADARELADVYHIFIANFSAEQTIQFSPEIKGAGFMSLCRGDISIDGKLYEVKTVNRNFAGKDIRQLILYLALQAATGERRWHTGGVFNPRRAVTASFSVDSLIRNISGGRGTVEVFQEIIDFLLARDIEIDAIF